MKAGQKTSEFWLSVLTIVAATGALFLDKIDGNAWSLSIGGVAGLYSVSRGAAKILPPKDEDTSVTVGNVEEADAGADH